MTINILDAGIRYHAGHHYDYGRKPVKHLAGIGRFASALLAAAAVEAS